MSPSNGAWVSTTPLFTWSSSSTATSYTLTIFPTNGTAITKPGITTTSYQLSASDALSGTGNPYTWRVTAYDDAGASRDTSAWSLLVDVTPPSSFSIVRPEVNAWVRSSDNNITWNAPTDTGGISQYRVYIDGTLCAEVDTTMVIPRNLSCELAEGDHIVAVSAVDASGNLTWCSDAPGGQGGRRFRIDDTGPGRQDVGGTFMLSSWSAPPPGGGTDSMIDTGLNFDLGQEVKISATGTWCFLSCSTGCFGAGGESSASGGVPAPDCNHQSLIAHLGPYECVGTGRTFVSRGSGKLYLGANALLNGCSEPTLTATVVGGRAFDLVAPADMARLSYPWPTFSWEAAPDQGAGGVTYQLHLDDGIEGSPIPGTTLTLADPLTEGTHRWYIVARDLAGNRTESVERVLVIDTSRPEAFILDTPANNGCVTLPTPNLCWHSVREAVSYQLFVDDSPSTTTQSTCTTPAAAVPQGEHTWYVTATDATGNVRRSSDTRTLRVDNTAPGAPTLVAPANGAAVIDPPIFRWNVATDNIAIDHYEIYVDGALRSTITAEPTWVSGADLAVGQHSWYVVAYDACGLSTLSESWTFTVEPCVPDGAEHRCPGYGLGKCQTGIRTCTAAGTWGACSGGIVPEAEICNGEDDDCDGVVDDGRNDCGGVCTLNHRLYEPCDGDDADRCQEGLWVCDGTNTMICAETTPNNVEVCNNRDDDCDGVVDNGCTISPPDAGAPDAAPVPDAAVRLDGKTDTGMVIADAAVLRDASPDGARDTIFAPRDTAAAPDVVADAAQARDALATLADGPLPDVWPADASNVGDAVSANPDAPAVVARDSGDGRADAMVARNDAAMPGVDGGARRPEGDGCSCAVGQRGSEGNPWIGPATLLGLALLLSRRRLGRRR